MPNLVACINVWNEAELLPICLTHAYLYFDKFVIADGAYIGRAKKGRSTDKTWIIATKFKEQGALALLSSDHINEAIDNYGSLKKAKEALGPKPTILIPSPDFWPSEVHKRNRMLEEVGDNDWHFYVDGDWKCIPIGRLKAVSKIKSLPDDIDSMYITITKPYVQGSETIPYPVYKYPDFMAFRKRHGLHYELNHVTLIDEDGTFVWDRQNWKCIDLGWAWEEMIRTDTIQRRYNRMKVFNQGYYVELSNGKGSFYCADCKYGLNIKDENNTILGFIIPRGMRQVCPRCGAGNIEEPNAMNLHVRGIV